LKLHAANGEHLIDDEDLDSRYAASANASRTYIPEEYRRTGASMNSSHPENATTSSNFLPVQLPRPETAGAELARILIDPFHPQLELDPVAEQIPIVVEVVNVDLEASISDLIQKLQRHA
jgi:hypothetical protein